MANTKVTQHVIANNAIQEAMITNAAVTPDKLHGTLDLSSKTLTLPSAQAATTQSALDNSTKIATTAYVDSAVTALIDSAPSGLNTLNELAAALNDDTSFSSTVTTSIAAKLPLAGGTMTGQILAANGTASAPSYAFSGQASTGMYKPGTSQLYFSVAGTRKLRVEAAQIVVETALYANTTLGVTGVATFADAVTMTGTGALKLPVGTTGERPTAATGQIRYNSTDGAIEVYNGSAWTAVGTGSSNKVLNTFTGDGSTTTFTLTVTPANEDALMVFIDGAYQEAGDYVLTNNSLALDTAPLSGEKVSAHITTASVHDGTSALNQAFTGDGSTTAFTLSQDPKSENNTQVYINGVYQQKTDYTVSGTTLTFDTAPTSGDIIEVNMFTVATLGNSDTVTEGSSNLYHTTARAISAISNSTLTGNLTLKTSVDNSLTQGLIVERSANSDKGYINYNGGAFQIRSTIGDPIAFGETDAEHMRIAPDGNVGIGITSSIDSNLHVADGTAQINIEGTSGDATLKLESTGNSYWNMFIDESDARKLKFEDNGNGVALTIQRDGDIGIGTNSPSHDVHIKRDASETALAIQSNVGGSGSAVGGRLRLQLGAQTNTGSGAADTQAGDILGQIMFEGQGTDYSYQGGNIKTIVTTGDGDDGRSNQGTAMTFETLSVGSVSPVERMRIASDGVITYSTGPSAGAVGTYALLWRVDSGTGNSFGDTLAGSNLRAANTYHNGQYSNFGYGSTSVSGTWRCMGNTGIYNGSTAYSSNIWIGCTIWVRIS